MKTQTYPTGETVANTYYNAEWLVQFGTSQGSTALLSRASYSFNAPNECGEPATLLTSATFRTGDCQPCFPLVA